MNNKICSGFGFHKSKGPYLIIDVVSQANGTSKYHWERFYEFLKNTTISLSLLDTKYCIGYYDLSTMQSFACPYSNTVTTKFQNCSFCFYRTGFNPAFYNVDRSKLSLVQRKYNLKRHYVYIAAFNQNNVKVGIACEGRLMRRLTEQGARIASIIGLFEHAYQARNIEAKISTTLQLPEKIMLKNKKHVLSNFDVHLSKRKIQLLKQQIIAFFQIKEDFPKIYDLNAAYLIHTLDTYTLNYRVLSKNERNLTGLFYGMVGGLLLVKAHQNLLTVLDIKKYLGSVNVEINSVY